jgi:hypothetical protein
MAVPRTSKPPHIHPSADLLRFGPHPRRLGAPMISACGTSGRGPPDFTYVSSNHPQGLTQYA